MDEALVKDSAPKFHNPAKLYDDEMMKRKAGVKTPSFAPKDKLEDLRKQPDWILPELRQWASLPDEVRLKAVKDVIGNTRIEKHYKEKCLCWALSIKSSRRVAAEILNFVYPKEK